MEEIKFRAWMGKARVSSEEGFAYFSVGENFFCEGLTVQQFTGYKDANGKDIYVGDILWVTGVNQPDLQVIRDIKTRLNIPHQCIKYEVVSNIHEIKSIIEK